MKHTGKGQAIVLGMTLGLISSLAFTANEAHSALGNTVQPIQFDFAVGTEAMTGDTTYSIGGDINYADGDSESVHFPISELEWPMDIWLVRFDASVSINSNWKINGTLKTNISDPDDPMIDRDWLTISDPGQLDVYSESGITDFSTLIWDFNVEWSFLQDDLWNLYTGAGYMHQNFDYTGQLNYQYSPSGQSGMEYYGDGITGITYETTYTMPYLMVGGDFAVMPNLVLAGGFSYSPFVSAEDEDHHLLRDKVSMGDMEGDAFMFNVSGTYYFIPTLFMEAGFQYTSIEADGTQTQTADGEPLGRIDMESESTQSSAYLTIGYSL